MKKSLCFLTLGLLAMVFMAVAEAAPDLYVSEFSLNPETPVQGSPVTVRLGVYNMGNSSFRAVHCSVVAWRELPGRRMHMGGRRTRGAWRKDTDMHLPRISELVC